MKKSKLGTESKYYKEIISKLEKLVKREYSFFAVIGLQSVLLIGALTYTTFTILEALFHFNTFIRTVFFFIFLLFTGAAFVIMLVNPLLKYFNIFRKTNYHKVAEKAGNNFQFIKDDLLNAMQLVSGETDKKNYSSLLIDAAFLNIYNRTKAIEFESVVSFKKARELFRYLSVVIAVCLLLFVLVTPLQAAAFRLIHFNREFISPVKYTFEVRPGNTQVTKGSDVPIFIKVNGAIPQEVSIAIKESDQTKFEYQHLKRDSLGFYNYELKSVRYGYKYFVKADDISSEEFTIGVIDQPVIKTLEVNVTSPAYSKIPVLQQKDNGNVTALPGSIVELRINSTKNLQSAKIVFDDSMAVPLRINGSEARGSFKIKKDNAYRIIITDRHKNENLSPITYSVKAMQDSYPSIDIIAPNDNINLPADNRITLLSKISDDYGFTKLTLNYRLASSGFREPEADFKTVEIPIDKNLTEQDINYIWNLSQMQLSENDVVSYFLEVFDNDNVNGPKSTRSPQFTVRVPSLGELLSQSDETQDNAVNDLQETLKQAEDLKKDIEKISQELKQDKKDINWDEKQKIEKTLEQFKKLQEKSEEIGKKIDQLRNNLQQNNLLSKETLEKYTELQKLFDNLSGEDMKKAMENMQNVLQSLDRQQIQQALENYKFNEEQFKASIERTMNLLKRIQAEQKVNDLLNRIEELTKKQNELQKDTKGSNEKNKNDLSRRQDQISKELNDLKKEMKKLSEKMSELKDLPKDQLDTLRQEFEKQNNEGLSKEALQQIQQSQKQLAMQNQQQIINNMQEMKKGMQQLQQSMQQQNQVQTFLDMMKLTDNLITLSKEQESLKGESEKMDPNSSAFNRNSEKQNNIQRNLDKIFRQMSELSQKTFAITPEMGKALGDAQRAMMRSLEAMQNRNGSLASGNQAEAMKGLNEAAAMMKNSMEQMMSGKGQGGMMSLLQQMGMMAQQQMGLNNLTQMLQQSMQGSLTIEQQAQLQRLAQQQDAIRKTLEQLNDEAKASGQSKTLAANMDKMLEQMQEVVKDMQTQKLDDNVVQKQEHILSRMLDAQKSVNERDFERNRESYTGKNIIRQSPSDLNLSSEKGKNKLRDELNKAVQEGFSKDYEELIRKYYEALQKEKIKNNN